MSEIELSEPPGGGVKVTLPSFEGPLDLLLHLCQKHELDVLDIPIGFVTEKYLEYLAVMQLINLDIASEYLVMAATLAHIKSKMLLPAPPPGQEDELTLEEQDPREALIRRLLEYQKYKQAGEELASRGVAGRDVFTRGMPIEQAAPTGLPPLAQVPLYSLVEAFQGVLAKSKVKLSHDIVHERVTLTDRINELVDILRAKKKVTFDELFQEVNTRFDLVITFLALLEMTRLRMTRIFQTDFDSPIYIEFAAQISTDEEQAAAGDEGLSDGSATTPPAEDAPNGPSELDGSDGSDGSDGDAEAPLDADGRATLTDAVPAGEIDDLATDDDVVEAIDTESLETVLGGRDGMVDRPAPAKADSSPEVDAAWDDPLAPPEGARGSTDPGDPLASAGDGGRAGARESLPFDTAPPPTEEAAPLEPPSEPLVAPQSLPPLQTIPSPPLASAPEAAASADDSGEPGEAASRNVPDSHTRDASSGSLPAADSGSMDGDSGDGTEPPESTPASSPSSDPS